MAVVNRSQYDVLRQRGGVTELTGWRLLRVSGADRVRFLHSQVTSDVRALEPGRSHLSALLTRSGKVRAFFHLLRRMDDVLLLAPAECSETVCTELEDAVIADQVEVELLPDVVLRLVLGPEAVRLRSRLPVDQQFPIRMAGEDGVVTWSAVPVSLPPLDLDLLDRLQVLAGFPRWGVDVDVSQLVMGTLLMERAVSLSKGCSLGQETVAKVMSGRGPAHRVMALEVLEGSSAAPPMVGERLEVGGKRAGVVLGTAELDGRWFVQVRLGRELCVVGRRLAVRGESWQGEVVVRELPVVPEQSRSDRATELYQRALAVHTHEDDTDGALDLLERSVVLDPKLADAYEAMGVLLGQQGDLEEAKQWMHRLLEVDSESIMAHTNLSRFLMQQGRIEEAEEHKRLAAEQSWRHAEREAAKRHDLEARRQAVEGDRQRREEMFRQVLELDPDDTLARFGLGELALERGDAGAATELLASVLERDPRHSAAYLALGRAHEALGEVAAAREVYERGVEVAASRGDLKVATTIQGRLAELAMPEPVPVG